MEVLLEVADATVVRDGTRVLDRVSLRVRAGEHAAVLGPNGSGKSSLIRLLTLEDRPLANGSGAPALRWFGRDGWALDDLRRQLGIVTGDLDRDFAAVSRQGRVTALEAVISGFFARQGVFAHHDATPALRRRAMEALDRVDASLLASRLLSGLSAGERRRVLIARALVGAPRALLLDEPTSGLDLIARRQFMDTLRRLAREGTTIILVTHHVEEIFPEISRVLLLQAGRVVYDDVPTEALTSDRLTRVFGAAVRVERSGAFYTASPM